MPIQGRCPKCLAIRGSHYVGCEDYAAPDAPSKAEQALWAILNITEATHDRPYTALSQIDCLAHEGLRP